MNSVEVVENLCRTLYDSSLDHGWPHVERVLGYALKIARLENIVVDERLLRLAVYLHDVGRIVGDPHAYYSALIAEELLREVGVSHGEIQAVTEAIKAHSYSYSRQASSSQNSVLAAILSDADKLDALGVVGFIRVFTYGCRHGRSMEESIAHFYEKILCLKEYMKLESSRSLAECLTRRTQLLLSMLEEEARFECSNT